MALPFLLGAFCYNNINYRPGSFPPELKKVLMQIWEWEKKLAVLLKDADSPELCARLLLRHVSGKSEIEYLLARREELDPSSEPELMRLVERRQKGEPMAYILGYREFYSRRFAVSPSVLVPRPETELLVDLALKHCQLKNALVIDAGCGSACIGISLALERPGWKVCLLDLHRAALDMARINSDKFKLKQALILADMTRMPFRKASIDLLVSNPPYIGLDEVDAVMPSVLAYEPHSALFSAGNGLAHIEALCRAARHVLRPGGLLLVEHGCMQGKACLSLFRQAGLAEAAVYRDLSGRERCCMGRKI